MNTPICDFVRRYNENSSLRMHMPGHKGKKFLGFEHLDITEFDGADDLYNPTGIIKQSEDNASKVFGFPTYYSTEGASHCIRAMMYLVVLNAKKNGKKPIIAAGRNAHKAFVSAASLLDFRIAWLYPRNDESYLSCNISPEAFESFLENAEEKPVALYLTSPDYLGNIADIEGLSRVCRKYGILLAVDNAHGAYLKFLEESRHPINSGAHLCCDSAHKTLPVVTGGAYLHIAKGVSDFSRQSVKNALALFGSTSPSYLILQSLDVCNLYLEGYKKKLADFLPLVAQTKASLEKKGYCFYGDEPMKLTISAKAYGYTGIELADILKQNNVFCEFSDPDYLVLMPTPETEKAGLERVTQVLESIPRKDAKKDSPPKFTKPEKAMSVREASISPSEILPTEECEGRILSAVTVGCPPAVPIVVCGERITKEVLDCFKYYGITECSVTCE
ncbi:MAG: amino acid decarboxylase [Clostridia bacterium]|nr:amino acid decarboxylase [Clostridia bacterium]